MTKRPTPAARARRPSPSDPLAIYLDEIHRIPLLSDAEQREMARKVAAGEPGARRRMIEANLRLVPHVIRKIRSRSGIPVPDLIGMGNIGLIRAVEKFDPDRGVKFSAYAAGMIGGVVRRGIATHGTYGDVPSYLMDRRRRAYYLRIEMEAELGRSVEMGEAMDRLGFSAAARDNIKQMEGERWRRRLSGGDFDLREIPDRDEPDGEPSEVSTWLESRMVALSPVESDVVRAWFGLDAREPKTLAEIARDVGLSPTEARRIRNGAIGGIRRDARTAFPDTPSTPEEGRETHLTLGGTARPPMEWARITGISYGAIIDRKRRGWSDEDTLTTPTRPYRKGDEEKKEFW